VLIHGVAGSGAIWGTVAHELEKQFDVTRIDLLGYGYSPKPDVTYTMDEHIAAIRSTIVNLKFGQPITLVGLSMGALVVLEYAARFPTNTKRVVCVGLPYYRSATEARDSLRGSFWANVVIRQPWLAHILITVIWGNLACSRTLSAWFAPKNYTPDMVQESMMARYQSFSSTLSECLVNFRLEPILPKLTMPILLIHGSRDRWTPASDVIALARRLPHAQVQVIDGYVHNIVIFAPRAVAKAIIDTMKS
jgi:pimeloyl-ACP methyl ester carboxylesterase